MPVVRASSPTRDSQDLWAEVVKIGAPLCARIGKAEAMNVCEHGDHEAPDGQRFCSHECEVCERTEFDESASDCAGICLSPVQRGHAEERKAIVTWLRSDPENVDPIGGDNHVARTLADAIERGAHRKP